MNCPSCGTELVASARFCGSCGYQMTTPPPAPAPYAQSPYPSNGPADLGYASTGYAAGYGAPGYGAPGYGAPGYGAPGYAPLPGLAPVPSYDAIVAGGVSLPVGEVLGEAWDLTKQNLGGLLGGLLVLGFANFGINLVLGLLPFVGSFASLAVTGPLAAGGIIAALRIVGGRELSVGHFFDGFKKFGPLALGYVVPFLFQLIPAVVLVVPLVFAMAGEGSALWLIAIVAGLLPLVYLGLAFMWTQWLVLDRDESFWTAMMGSMKVVNRSLGSLFVFGLALCLVNLGGLLALGVGLFVTIPLSVVATGVAFRRIFGLAGGVAHLG